MAGEAALKDYNFRARPTDRGGDVCAVLTANQMGPCDRNPPRPVSVRSHDKYRAAIFGSPDARAVHPRRLHQSVFRRMAGLPPNALADL